MGDDRVCGWCGAVLVRKVTSSGKLETMARYIARSHCGRKCEVLHRFARGWKGNKGRLRMICHARVATDMG